MTIHLLADLPEPIAALVSPQEGGCWTWLGRIDRDGYGKYGSNKRWRTRAAHRIVYRLLIGEIPDGLTIDHTCHNADTSCAGGLACPHRRCVNPAHLEAVTTTENTLRADRALRSGPAGPMVPNESNPCFVNARKTACIRGHEFDVANTYWGTNANGKPARRCRRCAENRRRERYWREKAAKKAA